MNINDKIVNLLDEHFGNDPSGVSWFTLDSYEEQDVIYLVCCSLDDSLEMISNNDLDTAKVNFEFAKNLFSDLIQIIDTDFFKQPISEIIDMFNSIDMDPYNLNSVTNISDIKSLKNLLLSYVEYMQFIKK